MHSILAVCSDYTSVIIFFSLHLAITQNIYINDKKVCIACIQVCFYALCT